MTVVVSTLITTTSISSSAVTKPSGVSTGAMNKIIDIVFISYTQVVQFMQPQLRFLLLKVITKKTLEQ